MDSRVTSDFWAAGRTFRQPENSRQTASSRISRFITASLRQIRFQGYISDHLEVSENGFAHLEITDQIINDFHVDTASASNMINSFNYIKGVYVWTFVTYDAKNQLYKVNIRSKGPVVNEIASKYHGGGHKFASGVRTSNKEDIAHLLKDLEEACKEYKDSLKEL